ncbi:MAG: DUF2971 domain-containing protein [Bacteroidaceae bacterium]|nr:DUF2971 domain-containing protein [Bacteroidaceae bacterium]
MDLPEARFTLRWLCSENSSEMALYIEDNHKPLAIVFYDGYDRQTIDSPRFCHFADLCPKIRECQYQVMDQKDGYRVYERKMVRTQVSPDDMLQSIQSAISNVDYQGLIDILSQGKTDIAMKALRLLHSMSEKGYLLRSYKTFLSQLTLENLIFEEQVLHLDFVSELHLFNILVGRIREQEICKYTTLDTLFQILSNQTYRMQGLAGMNDKGERNFLRTKLYEGYSEKRYNDYLVSQKEGESMSYIMSCTSMSKCDHLEMWRLYADDAKGVCLVFECGDREKDFMLLPIRYDRDADARNEETAPFRFIKDIVKELEKIGVLFVFKYFDRWASCFKSGDYGYEKEIRLVYPSRPSDGTHESKEWLLTRPNSIINPFVEFALTDAKAKEKKIQKLPLKLKKIYLGPKCPEQETNIEQIRLMIKKDPDLQQLGISDEDIQPSIIKNYR